MNERFRGTRVVQLVADLAYGDAVSDDCLAIQRVLRRWGVQTQLYATRVDVRLRREGRELHAYHPQAGELVILHYSLWSDAAEAVLRMPDPRLVLVYHNITPPEFFAGVNPLAEAVTRRGRAELGRFAPRTRLALGKSEYSRRELERAGFARTGVLPFFVDLERLGKRGNPQLDRRLADGRTNILCVGRLAPNKRQEDVVRAFYCYHRDANPNSRLILVGSPDISVPYYGWLQRLVSYLGLDEAVSFAGHVPLADLVSYYRAARAYLCLSEHEGFCVPLVEAMHLGVPVVAHAAAAVPETLGYAGILVHRKDPSVIAEILDLVCRDPGLRARLTATGKRRATEFAMERLEATLAEHLHTALAES